MKSWHVWVSIAAVIILGFLLSQDSLAQLALQKFGRPDVALIRNRRDPELAMWLGSYYFNGTLGKSEYNLNKAEKAYKRAVALDPGILWGHYQLARIYFVKGAYKLALEEIGKELEANPGNLRSLYVRGLIYGYRNWPGDLEKAEADFRRFTQWAPKEWAGYNDLAWILSKAGKHRDAQEAILAALREVPGANNNPWLWNSRGVAELNLEEYENAQTSFKKAKLFADNIGAADWQEAYPGNDPSAAESGVHAFLDAIEKNLERARQGVNN